MGVHLITTSLLGRCGRLGLACFISLRRLLLRRRLLRLRNRAPPLPLPAVRLFTKNCPQPVLRNREAATTWKDWRRLEALEALETLEAWKALEAMEIGGVYSSW